tara:strand:- start:369 stop:512 length:144 start_codon:yes stop_codon:yes gene_type:complete
MNKGFWEDLAKFVIEKLESQEKSKTNLTVIDKLKSFINKDNDNERQT